MSTIASPRASTTFQSPTASSRSSLSTDRPNVPNPQRRNRSALRDYYNLKTSSDPTSNTSLSTPNEDVPPPSALDAPSFDAQAYVSDVLSKESLEGVLRVEAGLIGEIRGLDGERKALVYDNYSKLIAATDTIRRMRTNMDPLVPMTTTLEPAVAHIAQTAGELGRSLRGSGGARDVAKAGDGGTEEDETEGRRRQVDTVKWVLAAPQRLEKLIREEKREEAEVDWAEVRGLLDHWEGVKGVQEVREHAEAIMRT